jgi:uncharacterized membrane-anchored protein
MRKTLLTGFILLNVLFAKSAPPDSVALQPKEEARIYRQFNKQLDSLDKRMEYSIGQISLAGGMIHLTVPDGFKFIKADQCRFILEDIWGNMPDKDVFGMLVRDGFKVTKLGNDYSFVISYSEIGYVSDNKDIDLNHADLLANLKSNMQISNEYRIAHGINTMSIKGWALVPYFDAYKKAVYWANNIHVNGTDEEVLNYNLRLLGKSGVIKISAVATMDQLPAIKQVLPLIITQVKFENGEKYADFTKGKDVISEWTVNELIAGKGDKSSFFLYFLTSWKLWVALICLGIAGYAGISILKTNRLSMASTQ